jgi:hypothetical protein
MGDLILKVIMFIKMEAHPLSCPFISIAVKGLGFKDKSLENFGDGHLPLSCLLRG